jgi:putative flippase GtrA
MNGTELSAAAGILLSLIFSYIPFVNDWYAPKDSQTKSLIMLVALAVVAGGAYGASCLGWWPVVVCGLVGAKTLVTAFVAALITNQATYKISPPRKPTPVVAPVVPPAA